MTTISNIIRDKKLDIPMLDMNNYAEWSTIMEFMLKSDDLWDIVNGSELAPEPRN